ncbi:MAG: hypothetical protein J0L75_20965 [Spirochaetes bacterium]|nr:hypothetical protein [Spirochaetota bacterium]
MKHRTPFLLIWTLVATATAAILPYSPPGDLSEIARLGRSEDYAVTIRGQTGGEKPCFVYASTNYWEHKARKPQDSVSFTSFAFADEPVTVTVECLFPVQTAELHPKQGAVPLAIDGNCIRFTLPAPRQLALAVNDTQRPLLLFAEAPEIPDTNATHYFAPGSVTRLGAKFEIKDGESVYIAGGAVVEATFFVTGNRNTYRGRGILSSGFIPWPQWDADKTLCQFGAPKFRTLRENQFEGLILLNSPGWWVYGDVVQTTVRGVKSIAWNGNSDGIHLGGDSLMEDCFFFVNDDCLIANGGSRNTWRRCTIWRSPWGHPIISLLTKRQSRDYLWEDIDVIATEGGGPIITLKNYKNWGVGGTLENFTVRDVRIEGPRVGPLLKIEAAACTVRRFLLDRVRAETTLDREGLLAFPAEGADDTVEFRDVTLAGKLVTSLDETKMKTEGDCSGVKFSTGR